MVDDLADFLAWLKYPKIDKKVILLNLELKYRAETINAILDTVLAFYHYVLAWRARQQCI